MGTIPSEFVFRNKRDATLLFGFDLEHPFDADDSIENLNTINKVIEMLNINLVK
jgi:hypothetical protein